MIMLNQPKRRKVIISYNLCLEESAEFKWEVEAYPKKVTKVAEQAPKNPKSKIVEIPAEVVERQTIPVEKSTSP